MKPKTSVLKRRSPHGGADRNDYVDRYSYHPEVAPRTGARIETAPTDFEHGGTGVAPRTGARIETTKDQVVAAAAASLPARGRGSKLQGERDAG